LRFHHIFRIQIKRTSIMSSDKASNESTGKPAPPVDNTGSKNADSHNTSSTRGHEDTGAEKYDLTGGSGGVTIRGGQGYEHLAHH
jgi:hypothetical protein